MFISEFCCRDVIMVHRGDFVGRACELMRQNRVSTIVVVEGSNGGRAPVGIVHDWHIIACGKPSETTASERGIVSLTVEEIMEPEPTLIHENCELFDAIHLMRFQGVRRLPVVDGNGWLTGIVTLDDLLRYYRYPH